MYRGSGKGVGDLSAVALPPGARDSVEDMTTATTPDVIPVPRIEGRNIVLREHTFDDVEGVYERSVDAATQHFTTIPHHYTRAMAEEYITLTKPTTEKIEWAIELDGEYAGSIDLRTFGKGFEYGGGALGFVTSPWARGRGVMTEAVALTIEQGFTRGLETITWDAHAGNIGSWKAAWRNGFHDFTYVPNLLVGKDGLEDAWHAVLHVDDPREPQGDWREAIEASATPPEQRGI